MTTEQICFRYDGSEEAKKCLIFVNKYFTGLVDKYYTSDGVFYINIPTTHRLVTPAEFLRLVSEPQWKVGDECYLQSNNHYKWKIVSFHKNNLVKIKREDYEVYYLTHLLRPVRKSLREEIIELINQLNPPCLPYKVSVVADGILATVRNNKDEL